MVTNCGDSSDGLTLSGGEYHIFGQLSLPFPDKDLKISGNSFFWGHPSAEIFISDDWEIAGNANVVVDGICVEVDDDFHINGTTTVLCGNGGVSIGADNSANTFNFMNGATANQMCLVTTVYRGVGGDCQNTVIQTGLGNQAPIANDDSETTRENNSIDLDVLNMGTSDSDPDNDELLLLSAGTNGLDGFTAASGRVILRDNGTPGIPSDDYFTYIPLTDFVGQDSFQYFISDQNGGVAMAKVLITVSSSSRLPVVLTAFEGYETACDMLLTWETASEDKNDQFELEHSVNGRDFMQVARIQGNGSTELSQFYQYTHQNPSRKNYYRLRQVDFDGSSSLSDVIVLESTCFDASQTHGLLNVFPNPVAGSDLTLKISATQYETQAIYVSDMMGRFYYMNEYALNEGMNTISLPVADLSAGNYLIKVGMDTQRFTKVEY